MPNVFLLYMPPGNTEAMVHYQDTIKNKVPLTRIAKFISRELHAKLTSIFGNSPIAVWGSQDGQRNRSNFEGMSAGDDVLIVEGASVKLIGKIAAKVDSQELSRELWQTITDHGDTTWKLIYFIANPRELNLSFTKFCELFGYATTYRLRGFTTVSAEKVEQFYSQYDDLYSVLVRLQQGQPVLRKSVDLSIVPQSPPELIEVGRGSRCSHSKPSHIGSRHNAVEACSTRIEGRRKSVGACRRSSETSKRVSIRIF